MSLISPYNLYKWGNSLTIGIKILISTKRPAPKEYVQSFQLDQCALTITQVDQYITLKIPHDLIAQWKREGYTHLYLCGIRLILTLLQLE